MQQQIKAYDKNEHLNMTLDQMRYSYHNPIIDPTMATPQAQFDFSDL